MGFYEDDLAYAHDQGFGELSRSAATALRRELAARDISSGTVCDLGCGSGILARALTDAGFAVVGIDLSEGMLRLARRRVPEADFRVGSIVRAKLPPCVAVTAVGEVINYLADTGNDDDTRAALFRRVYDSLKPGGCFLFDSAGPGRGEGRPDGFREAADWAVLWRKTLDADGRTLRRHHTIFRRIDGQWRRSTESHAQQLVSPAVILAQLSDCGFETEILSHYDDLELLRGLIGFMARKPAV